jgi:hypothetical protein
LAKAALTLEVFLSIGTFGGGAALMLGPRGEMIPLPLSAPRGSPFEIYFVPGLILFCEAFYFFLGAVITGIGLAWRTKENVL